MGSDQKGGIILWGDTPLFPDTEFTARHKTTKDPLETKDTEFIVKYETVPLGEGLLDPTTFIIRHNRPIIQRESFLAGRIFIPAYREEDTKSRVIVKHRNKLTSKLKVGKFSWLPSHIIVSRTEISTGIQGKIRVNSYYDFRSRIKVLRYSELVGELTVRKYDDFTGKITIPPRNKMSGYIDLYPIPRKHLDLEPIKDAFFRSGVPRLNYGTESTMITGSINDSLYSPDGFESFRSILQFDLSKIPDTAVVEKAVLRLTPSSPLSEQEIEIKDSLGSWEERLVAWVNQPQMGNYSKVVKTNQGETSQIEVDILDLVKKWVEEGKPNFGMLLKTLDENNIGISSFFTREAPIAGNRPRLQITYYDPTEVVSPGAANLRTRISTIAHRGEGLPARIEIKSHLGEQFLPATMYVSNPNIREGRITISRREMQGILYLRQPDDNVLEGNIVVPSKRIPVELHSRIIVSKPILVGRIYIRGYGDSDLDSKIIVANTKHNDSKFQVTINQLAIRGELHIKNRNKLKSMIVIPSDDENELRSRITVQRTGLPSIIAIKDSDSIDGTLIIPYKGDSTIHGEITVNNNILRGEIRVHHFSDLRGHINVGNYTTVPLQSRITINKNEIAGRISISRLEYVDGKIIISRPTEEDLEGSLYVRGRKELQGRIEVERADYLESVIRTISPYLPAKIAISEHHTSDIEGSIIVNVKMISELVSQIKVKNPRDLYCIITVKPRKAAPAYAFIM